MQLTKLLNGKAKNQDHDLQLLATTILNPGVVSGLEVTTNSVSAGKGFISVTRDATPDETFLVQFELTEALTIDTSGSKKVYIEIPQANVDNMALNTSVLGESVGAIGTGASYPATNPYIPLASITGGVITDARSIVKMKESALDTTVQALINTSIDTSERNDNYKARVKAATVANITLSGAQTIDGISCVAGDRVLVKAQTLSKENGVYIVNASTWTRSTDMDTSARITGATIFVEQGSTLINTFWFCYTPNPVLETDAINFRLLNPDAALKFGGNGSDGDLTVSTDTVLNPAYKVFQYNNLTINSAKTLSFGANYQNKVVYLFVKGDLNIQGTLSLKGAGATGGNGGQGGGSSAPTVGANGGAIHTDILDALTHYGMGGQISAVTATGGAVFTKTGIGSLYINQLKKTVYLVPGGGGGGGGGGRGAGSSNFAGGSGGTITSLPTNGTNASQEAIAVGGGGGGGGAGGGALVLFVAGNITIGASGVIDCSGQTGANGGTGGNSTQVNYGGGGGGGAGAGGGGGMALILYNGNLSNSGTINVSSGGGGAGGNGGLAYGGGSPSMNYSGGGAGGGGAYALAGGDGQPWTNSGNGGNATVNGGAGGGAGSTSPVTVYTGGSASSPTASHGGYVIEKNVSF